MVSTPWVNLGIVSAAACFNEVRMANDTTHDEINHACCCDIIIIVGPDMTQMQVSAVGGTNSSRCRDDSSHHIGSDSVSCFATAILLIFNMFTTAISNRNLARG